MLTKIEMRMTDEQLITPGGLATVGQLLNKTKLYEYIDEIKTKERANPKIKNSDVVGTHISLLCQGKSDFEAANELKEETEFYSGILGIKTIPSEETLRQRLDALTGQTRHPVMKTNVELLRNTGVQYTSCLGEHIPVDIDVTPFDNSNSKKEGVSLTYKHVKGYAPIFAYIGTEGYLLDAELRDGSCHSQDGTKTFLAEALKNAHRLTDQPLLVRMDSGNDSADNIEVCHEKETRADYIIKRNLRREQTAEWHALALSDENVTVNRPREGKIVYIGSTYRQIKRLEREIRIVYEITERQSRADGQQLIEPDIEVNTWWVSFQRDGEGSVADADIIKAYHDHGLCEQFHSELKTDMDIERLPSGYFGTNSTVLLLAVLAYNILRIIGQTSLSKQDAPLKRPVQRRRLRTVIQNLITMAVHVVRHARKIYFGLGNSNTWRFTFKRVYETLSHQAT
jgi:hypothetical protein